MSSFRKRQLVMDAETGLVGEVERVSRRFVTVVFPNAEEFLSRQIGFSRLAAAERLIRRKRGQRRFQHITTPTTTTHMTHDKEQAPC